MGWASRTKDGARLEAPRVCFAYHSRGSLLKYMVGQGFLTVTGHFEFWSPSGEIVGSPNENAVAKMP